MIELLKVLARLADEHNNLIESSESTGHPDPDYEKKWPALVEAYQVLRDNDICAHGNSIPDPDCGCGT